MHCGVAIVSLLGLDSLFSCGDNLLTLILMNVLAVERYWYSSLHNETLGAFRKHPETFDYDDNAGKIRMKCEPRVSKQRALVLLVLARLQNLAFLCNTYMCRQQIDLDPFEQLASCDVEKGGCSTAVTMHESPRGES